MIPDILCNIALTLTMLLAIAILIYCRDKIRKQ